MKLLGAALTALILGGCVANQGSDVASASKGPGKLGGSRTSAGGMKQPPQAGESFAEALDRVLQDIRNFFNRPDVAVAAEGATSVPARREVVVNTRRAPAQTSTVARVIRPVRAARASDARSRKVREARVEVVQVARTNAARASTQVSSPALEYERAMLAKDVAGLARAATQLTGRPVTEEAVRALNEQLGIEADDELVNAVARAAPR